MSEPQATPDKYPTVRPENEDTIKRSDDDPLRAALGEDGQGDIAPEDEPDGSAGTHRTDADAEPEPSTEDLQEPSTEKEPGEEPKAPAKTQEPQPSHEAVGIGVIGRPQTQADETSGR